MDPARLSALFVGGHNLDDLLSLMPTHWAFTLGHHNYSSFLSNYGQVKSTDNSSCTGEDPVSKRLLP